MRRLFTAIFLLLCICNSYGQDPIGQPEVSYFNSTAYKGGKANWKVAQDRNGVLYFANNEGLLAYNGGFWKTYPITNKTVLRSVKVASDGKIYIGAQDEFGYFSPNKAGSLIYHSLKRLIPKDAKQFADVWDIVEYQDMVFFRTVTKIFRLYKGKIDVLRTPTTIVYMGLVQNQIFAHEINRGIKTYRKGKWEIICDDQNILDANITSILPFQGDTLLVATLKNGLFLLHNGNLLKKPTAVDRILYNDRVNNAVRIDSNTYAFGTTSASLVLVDKNGKLQRRFGYAEGIFNSNVRGILVDKRKNLWLGLDDGIAYVAFNNAIKHIYTDNNKQIPSYTSRIFDNKLYLGTSNGVFYVPLTKDVDLSDIKASFKEVGNSRGQTWGLSVINGQLFLANEDKTLIIKKDQALQLRDGLGVWTFDKLNKRNDVVVGSYAGLQLLSNDNGNYRFQKTLAALDEPLRFIAVDTVLNCVWASHPYRGIFKFALDKDGRSVVNTKLFTKVNGLPNTLYNYVFKLKGKTVICTEKGIYQFEDKTQRFKPHQVYQKIFGQRAIQFLTEDKVGNIWFVSDKKVGVVDFSKKSDSTNFTIVEMPELSSQVVAGFENIYPYNDRNIFIGSNRGLIHIDYKKYADNILHPNVVLGQVKIINNSDSVIFGGYQENEIERSKIAYKYNSLHFEFASTLFEQRENIEFSYQLKGFDKDWSAWNAKGEKDYTNLAPGKYTFSVKARNNLGNESQATTYTFVISPPWYRSILAYIIYLLLTVFVIYSLIKQQEKQHRKQQEELKEKHQNELDRNEQKIIKLQKKQLEADVDFKNKELASATMHLVQRGKLLSKIGDELLPLVQKTGNSETAQDIKKVIRLLNDAKRIDTDWEQFASHFDTVHTNFLSNLKERYPNLSPADLKLCAYLKLNLSSKEIAQLLNITPRAVEVSRYRLRKKLGLTPDVNLFDFLFKNETENK